jgi:hypothetical protein
LIWTHWYLYIYIYILSMLWQRKHTSSWFRVFQSLLP